MGYDNQFIEVVALGVCMLIVLMIITIFTHHDSNKRKKDEYKTESSLNGFSQASDDTMSLS